MKYNKAFKLISIILVMIFFILLLNKNVSYAKIDTNITINKQDGKQFEVLGNSILSAVYRIGVFITVGALMIKGIRFMLGSAEEKSDEKKVLIYYLIGVILVITIPKIVKIIYTFATDLF